MVANQLVGVFFSYACVKLLVFRIVVSHYFFQITAYNSLSTVLNCLQLFHENVKGKSMHYGFINKIII